MVEKFDFEATAEIGRRLKQEQVAAHGDDPDEEAADLRPYVVFCRGGDQIGMILVGHGGEAVREACYWAAVVMRAHELYVVADARMRTYAPDTDLSHVRQGEFQEDWQAGRRQGITEAMLITYIPMLGDAAMAAFPYERSGKNLRWLKAMRYPGAAEGAVVDYARQGFAQARETWPKLESAIGAFGDMTGLTREQQEYHKDRACARYVSTMGDGMVVSLFIADVVYEEGVEVKA